MVDIRSSHDHASNYQAQQNVKQSADTLIPTTALTRRLNIWSIVGIGVCVSATYEAISAAMLPALVSGGSVTFLYGFILTCLASIALAASIAELSSIWPAAGGPYQWAAELSSEKAQAVVSWITGWLNFTAMFIGIAGATFGVSFQIQVYAIACNPTYVPERWHVSLIFIALIILMALFNIYLVKCFHVVNASLIGVHVVGFLTISITLLACTSPNFNSARYVFANFQNFSGWSNDGVSFCIGVMSIVTGFIGIEAPTHFAEEMKNAAHDLPRAILYTTVGNAVMTLPFIIIVLFCTEKVEILMASPIGSLQPLFATILQATGSNAGSILLCCFTTVIGFFSGLSLVGACSRTIWAMARDNAFPPSFAYVHPKWDVPVMPIVVIGVLECLYGCIYIGNATAFFGCISGVLILQVLSYGIPIGLHVYHRVRSQQRITYGPWRMNPTIGLAVNVVALCWIVFLTIFLSFPLYQPVTAANMNYAVVILAGIGVLSTVVYFTYARGKFFGPLREIPGEIPHEVPLMEVEDGKKQGPLISINA